jgi:hypothetical protein
MKSLMQDDASRAVPQWLVNVFLLLAFAFALRHATVLAPRWVEWRSGAPDLYPGQHRGLLVGAATGLLTAIALPMPLLLARRALLGRRARAALWSTWALAMAGTVSLLALG